MCYAAGEGVPAECGAVVTRFDVRGYGVVDQCCADGDPVAEGFRGGEDVWVDGRWVLGLGVGPERAGAREPALDLVEDENRADTGAVLAEGGEEFGRGDVDAAFALDGLDENAAGLLGDEGFEGGRIVEDGVFEAGKHGGEGRLVFGVGGRGQGAHCSAVEGVVEGEDFVFGAGGVDAAAYFAGEFDGCFVSFGAGVGYEGLG